MKVLIAPDKFKDALDAAGVCHAIARGIRYCDSQIQIQKHPLADGGEGTSEILTAHHNGKKITTQVHDPLFRKIEADFGLSKDEQTAFIDTASASGLQRLAPEERNCYHTTSYGTGELMQKAIDHGATHIVLGIGGSATHDCGMGLAAALGYKFLDVKGNELFPAGKNLEHLYHIEKEHLYFDENQLTIEVASDVQHPLIGENGAAKIFAPQKGANEKQIDRLEKGSKKWNEVVKAIYGKNLASISGSGAAGGLGAGMMAYFNAALKRGVDLVMSHTGFNRALTDSQWVITGEGKIDNQNLEGKVLKGVTEACEPFQIPVTALCGNLAAEPATIKALGIQYAQSIINAPVSYEQALLNTELDLEKSAYHLTNLMGKVLRP